MPVVYKKEIAYKSFAFLRRDILTVRKKITRVPVDHWETALESFLGLLADLETRVHDEILLYTYDLLDAGHNSMARHALEIFDDLNKDVVNLQVLVHTKSKPGTKVLLDPGRPVEPVRLVEIGSPVEPGRPVEPVRPVETGSPVEPSRQVEPSGSVGPNGPVGPGGSVGPSEPVGPKRPGNKTQLGVYLPSAEQQMGECKYRLRHAWFCGIYRGPHNYRPCGACRAHSPLNGGKTGTTLWECLHKLGLGHSDQLEPACNRKHHKEGLDYSGYKEAPVSYEYGCQGEKALRFPIHVKGGASKVDLQLEGRNRFRDGHEAGKQRSIVCHKKELLSLGPQPVGQGNFSGLFDEGSVFGKSQPIGRCAGVPPMETAPDTQDTNRTSARFKASKRSHPVGNSSEGGVVQESSLEEKLFQTKMVRSEHGTETCKPKFTKVRLSGSHKLLGKNLVKRISVPAAVFNLVLLIHVWQLCQLLSGIGATNLNEPCVYQKNIHRVCWRVDCLGSDVFVGWSALKHFKEGAHYLKLPGAVAKTLWQSFSHCHECFKRDSIGTSGACHSMNFQVS